VDFHHLSLEPLREGISGLTKLRERAGGVIPLQRHDCEVSLRCLLMEGSLAHLELLAAGRELRLSRAGELCDEALPLG